MLDPNALAGTLLDGRYRLHKFLGNGAFGYVFAADEIVLGEVVGQVAVKLIRPQNPKHRADVLHEIRAMSGLSHPHLLLYRTAGEVLFFGQTLIFLASELASGTLEDQIEKHRISTSEAATLTRNLASALIYLGERDVVHRDLKPANVLRAGNAWKIADFGLTRVMDTAAAHQTGAAGTLVYMSPEAIDGEIGSPGDMWALGVLLQQSLSGRYPYAPDTTLQFIRAVATREPFIAPGLPTPFETIVRGCLQKEARRRWTATQVLQAIQDAPVATTHTSLPIATPYAPSPPVHNTSHLPPQANDLIVAAAGDGTHRTLSEAIAAASTGARIWIRPGIYRESVTIDKPLEINGQGAREEIIIESTSGNCLRFDVAQSTLIVRGLTCIGRAATAGQKYFAICVARGAATLEDCAVTSDSLACLAVQQGAHATLRNCLIVKGTGDGVLFSQGARGLVESCEFSGHGRFGVHLKKEAAAQFRGCSIAANTANGVEVVGGNSEFDGCEIIGNGKAGVWIGAESAPVVRRCRIARNRQQAICAERGSAGVVEECDLRDNAFGAWDVASGSLLERRRNKEG